MSSIATSLFACRIELVHAYSEVAANDVPLDPLVQVDQ